MTGTGHHWKEDRGFGWFRLPNGKLIFCHITQWMENGVPEVGREVQFSIIADRKDATKEQAANARYMKNAGVDTLKAGI
jgi:cold shock CspA family protein